MAKKKKNKKNTPLDLNQTLVQGAGISNKQYGGETSLSSGEWRGDLMTKPILDAMVDTKLTEKESETTDDTKKKTNVNKNKKTNVKKIKKTEECDFGYTMIDGVCVKDKEDDKKTEKTKNTKTKKTKKTKVKDAKEFKVERKKRNAFQRLFSKDKSRYKRALTPEARRAQRDKMSKYLKGGGNKSDQAYKDMRDEHNETFYRVKKKGLFNDKTMSRAELDTLIKDNQLTRRGSGDNIVGSYYSPLDMNSREKYFSKTKRKNSQGNSPYAYKERVDDNTPFYQVEEVSSTNKRPGKPLPSGDYVYKKPEAEGNVFDLMEKYGMIDARKYGASLNLIGDEKPPQLLGPAASIAIDDFMKVQKEALYEAKTSKKGVSEETAIINNVQKLSSSMNSVGDWITETLENTDQETESDGSSVANRYLRDVVFTQKTDEEGKPLTTMIVNNNHGLSIKFRDTEGTYTLDSLKENIFPKAFDSFETLSKGMSTVKDEATSGMPFNETASKVLINNALKTEEQILSVIHDEESPLYQFLNDFAEGYPNANFDFAHIDSPNYSKEDLAPIVRDYALRKLRRQHALYSDVKQDISTLSPEEIIKKFS